MTFLKNSGFSLVSVMIAAGLLGGLSLAIMQVMKNVSDGQNRTFSMQDELELSTSIRMILDNPSYCRASLAASFNSSGYGPTPTTAFKKEDIDFGGDEVTRASNFLSTSEGLDVELWYSNIGGAARTSKKFNGDDNITGDDKSRFGKLKIKSIKLVMFNAPTSCLDTDNYCPGNTSDAGQLVVLYNKKISSSQTRSTIKTFPLIVAFTADSSGDMTITSCGPTPLPAPPQTTIIATHSQTAVPPSCPTNWSPIWTGYSFFMSSGSAGFSSGVDLGKPGSCLKEFRAMPFIECSSPNNCDFFTGGDYSFWLSAGTVDEGGVSGTDILSRISRCSVCEGSQAIITIHGQTALVPPCPTGWSSLWEGNSFLMGSGSAGFSAGVDLKSPGSCLKEFRPIPFIECSSPNNCDFFTGGDYSFWLSTGTVDEGGVSGTDIPSRISRCNVCSKDLSP